MRCDERNHFGIAFEFCFFKVRRRISRSAEQSGWLEQINNSSHLNDIAEGLWSTNSCGWWRKADKLRNFSNIFFVQLLTTHFVRVLTFFRYVRHIVESIFDSLLSADYSLQIPLKELALHFVDDFVPNFVRTNAFNLYFWLEKCIAIKPRKLLPLIFISRDMIWNMPLIVQMSLYLISGYRFRFAKCLSLLSPSPPKG